MLEINETDSKDAIDPISIESTEIILKQMKTSVCKIHGKNNGTGFFTKIPYKNQLLPVLITNNHILGENDILPDKIITFSINNGEIMKNIKIDSNRKRYTNENLDITIIELLEKDNIYNFLPLDKNIIDKINFNKDDISINSINSTKYFDNLFGKKKSGYILNYRDSNKVFTSYGLLTEIRESTIIHKCKTNFGSSGSPILFLETKTIIGIHCKGSYNFSFNYGTLLVKPLMEFQNISNNLLIITKTKKNNINNINNISKNQDNILKDIDRIYTDLNNYYMNEKDIIYNLNNKINQGKIYNGFLVDKTWVDRWKKYSYYEQIKRNYLSKNNNNEITIKNFLVENQSKNYLNYKDIDDVENYIIKDINNLKLPENNKKPFVLLNSEFLKNFYFKTGIIPINFYLYYQNIRITNPYNQTISFNSNNNIIIYDTNQYMYYSEIIKYLIKFELLKKELFSPNCFLQNKLYQVHLINRLIIEKLLQLYDLKNLIINLEHHQILAGVTYQNIEENYPKISKYLNEYQTNYIQSIKNLESQEQIKFSKNELSIIPKYLNGQSKLKIIEGFEIIDKNFADFFSKIFNDMMIPVAYIGKIDDKFYINYDSIYEILSFGESNNFIFEYAIRIINNFSFKDAYSLNKYVFDLIIKKKKDELKSQGYHSSNKNNIIVIDLQNFNQNENGKLKLPSSFGGENDKLYEIIFKTIDIGEAEILMEGNKTCEEAIKKYFSIINKPYLFGDKDILFLYSGCMIEQKSKKLIKETFIENYGNFLAVVDIKNKLS